MKNLERYREDLKALEERGRLLIVAMQYECHPDDFKEVYGKEAEGLIKRLPRFKSEYQAWYSEAKALIRQLLPDRLDDFVRHYQKPKPRKDISYENYRIEDYLQGLVVTRGWEKEKVVEPRAAIPHMEQQQAILESVAARFESSLFDVQQLVQSDLFDSELEAASALLKRGFTRAAGAVAGVVMEKHLGQVATNHNITTRKKHPTISDFNDLLKKSEVVDTPNWRQIQRLGDLRNLCDHSKERDPTKEEVEELIGGVEKFTKTLF